MKSIVHRHVYSCKFIWWISTRRIFFAEVSSMRDFVRRDFIHGSFVRGNYVLKFGVCRLPLLLRTRDSHTAGSSRDVHVYISWLHFGERVYFVLSVYFVCDVSEFSRVILFKAFREFCKVRQYH